MNSVYDKLSRISFLSKSYSFKFMFIAFVSVQIPLLALIIFINSQIIAINQNNAILIVIIATLIAAVITFYFINRLLMPLRASKHSLDSYLINHTLPTLPDHYKDEAGILMQKIQHTLLTLDNLIKEKKDFAALLSHDIRSPLNVFIGLSELIKEETNKDMINNYCDLIIQESQAQLVFLKDIMEMMEYNDLVIREDDMHEMSLLLLVQQAINTVQSQLVIKHITVETNVSANIILNVQPKLFVKALHNILTNAIKFSYEYGKINIVAVRENGHVNLQVQDYGLGFSQENAGQMFQRFTKMGRSGTKGEKSTGLGLYLTNTIITKHHGSILAKSEGENKGASFILQMPVTVNEAVLN